MANTTTSSIAPPNRVPKVLASPLPLTNRCAPSTPKLGSSTSSTPSFQPTKNSPWQPSNPSPSAISISSSPPPVTKKNSLPRTRPSSTPPSNSLAAPQPPPNSSPFSASPISPNAQPCAPKAPKTYPVCANRPSRSAPNASRS